jgi:hypothetical protein
MFEESKRQAFQSEADAGCVRDIAALIVDAPERAEMILMIVEA